MPVVRLEHLLVAGFALAVGLLAGVDPVLALVATLALGFVLVTMADVTAGLCLFALLTFVDQLPQLEDASLWLTKFAGALLAASWFASVATAGRVKTFVSVHPGVAYLLAFFLTWTGLSLVWSESLSDGFEAFVRYSLNVVLFLIVFTAVSDRRRAIWVVGAFVIAATASATFGLVSGPSVEGGEAGRAGGTLAEPNEFAAVLVAGLCLAGASAAAARRSPALRLAACAAAMLCVAGVFLSVSRAGLIALAVVLLAGVVIAGRWRPAMIVLLLCVSLSGVGYFAFGAAGERLTLADQGSGRIDIWTVGWRMVQDRPVTGVSAGNFTAAAPHYLLEPGGILRDEFIIVTPKVAHNIYLQVLAELGAVGLILFVSILGFSVVSAHKAAGRFQREGDKTMEVLARGVVLALLGLLVADFFASEQYSKQLWLLLGLGPALLALANGSGREAPPRARTSAAVPVPAQSAL